MMKKYHFKGYQMYFTTAKMSKKIIREIKIEALIKNIKLQDFIEIMIRRYNDDILKILKAKVIDSKIKKELETKELDLCFLLSSTTKKWIKVKKLKIREVVIVSFYIYKKEELNK